VQHHNHPDWKGYQEVAIADVLAKVDNIIYSVLVTTSEAILDIQRKCELSREDLAETLGVSAKTIYRLENGQQPTTKVLVGLEKFCRKVELKPLAEFFMAIRRANMSVRSESVASTSRARRVPFGDLASWAAKADEIETYSRTGLQLVKRFKSRSQAKNVQPSDLEAPPEAPSDLDAIWNMFQMCLISATRLAEDVEIYIAPPDKPGTITFKRLEAIKNAKAQARKI
jgi:DNA-binding XRE family transcriptional regulator